MSRAPEAGVPEPAAALRAPPGAAFPASLSLLHSPLWAHVHCAPRPPDTTSAHPVLWAKETHSYAPLKEQ